MTVFSERLQVYQKSVESALNCWLPKSSDQPERLHEAMRYSVLGNGKRIRPVILYATGEAFGIDLTSLDGPACAVEIIHAYSLIHDDLPAMDDDELRRGRPTCHKAYDEATAILAGDALQALSFHILAHDPNIKVSAQQRLSMIKTLAIASGSKGMAGGQAIDLASVGISLSIAELENMHVHKTGALIRASAELGALSVDNVDQNLLSRISQYAKCIGLAFQIKDDILDIESDTETLGKPQGSDIAMNKPTYPNLLGLEGAKKAADSLYNQALECLDGLDEKGNMLKAIADYIVNRNN
jgi:geranylgeranyl pyrophosphate synthase